MQIPEMFSYVGMKDTKYQVKCFLVIPKNTKWKKELKLNTILLLKLCMNIFLYIYLFASFPFSIYLYFYFQYLSTFKISKKKIVLKYNPKSEKVGTVWKTQMKKESSDF